MIYIYMYYIYAEYPQRQGPRFSQAGSQKDRCWYCCPPEQIPNVDLLWWLPQPQTDRCSQWGHSYGSHAPRPRGKHNPFFLGLHPVGTTPSGPMARRKITSVDVWKPLAAMYERMLAETRIDSGRTMWQMIEITYISICIIYICIIYVYIKQYIYI